MTQCFEGSEDITTMFAQFAPGQGRRFMNKMY